MAKKIAFVLLILALLMALLVGLVTWQFSALVTPQIERYLKRYGVETLQTSEVKWRFNRLRMVSVAASGVLDGVHLNVQLDNVDVGYQWWQLFDGTIDSIAVEQADIILSLPATDDEGDEPVNLAITTLLPHAWLPQLPVDSLTLVRFMGTVHFADNGSWEMLGKDLQMSASRQTLQGNVVVSSGNEGAPEAVHSDALVVLNITSSPLEPLAVGVALSSGGRLMGNAALTWPRSVDGDSINSDRQRLSMKGSADLDAVTTQLRLLRHNPHSLVADLPLGWLDDLPPLTGSSDFVLEAEIPDHIGDSYGAWIEQIEVTGTFSHRIGIASWPEPGLSNVKTTVEHSVAGNIASQVITLTAPLKLSAAMAAGDWWVPGELGEGKKGFDEWQGSIPLSVQVAAGSVLVADDSGWWLDRLDGALDMGPASQRLHVKAVLTDLVDSQESLTFAADIDASVSLDNQVILAPRLTAQVENHSQSWRGKGTAAEAGLGLTGQWQATLAQNGTYGIEVKGKVASLPVLLKQSEPYFTLPLALAEGAGSFTYAVQGSLDDSASASATSQRIAFNLTGLTGLLEGVALQGASIEGAVEKTLRWQSHKDIRIRVPALETGVSIEGIDIALQLLPTPSLAQTHWRVHDLGATLFSGTVTLREPFTLDFPLTETRFEMVLSNWQLGAILGLYEEHGLSGKGILSGVLPVQINSEGIAIEGGVLASQPPGGLIVYDTGDSGKAMAARNEHLDLAVSLLENFEYERLAINADFAPTGVLMLGLQLSGRNPDAFSGRPVNFNITVEENLFDLFKALTLTDDVINKLEKRLNR